MTKLEKHQKASLDYYYRNRDNILQKQRDKRKRGRFKYLGEKIKQLMELRKQIREIEKIEGTK